MSRCEHGSCGAMEQCGDKSCGYFEPAADGRRQCTGVLGFSNCLVLANTEKRLREWEETAQGLHQALILLLAWHDEVRRTCPQIPSPYGIEEARERATMPDLPYREDKEDFEAWEQVAHE